MKKFFPLLTLLAAVVLPLTLTSCSDDDDKDKGSSTSSLLGTWRTVEYTWQVKKGNDVIEDEHLVNPSAKECNLADICWKIAFNQSGGQWIWDDDDYEGFYRYTLSNNILSIQWEKDETDPLEDFDYYRVTFKGDNEITLSFGTDVPGTESFVDE